MRMLIVSGYDLEYGEGFRWKMSVTFVNKALRFWQAMMQCHLVPTGSAVTRCCVFEMPVEG